MMRTFLLFLLVLSATQACKKKDVESELMAEIVREERSLKEGVGILMVDGKAECHAFAGQGNAINTDVRCLKKLRPNSPAKFRANSGRSYDLSLTSAGKLESKSNLPFALDRPRKYEKHLVKPGKFFPKLEKDPLLEVQSSLIEGDTYAAGRSCLVGAQSTVAGRHFTMAKINAYRSPAVIARAKAQREILIIPQTLRTKFQKKYRTAFDPKAPCLESERTKMCRNLLKKAITDDNQASYGTEDSGNETRAELSPKVKQDKEHAIKNLEALLAEEKRSNKSSMTIANTNTNLNKTIKLLALMDAALARKNSESARGIIETLRDINPSAAHAIECLGLVSSDSLAVFDDNKKEVGIRFCLAIG